jgi:integrase
MQILINSTTIKSIARGQRVMVSEDIKSSSKVQEWLSEFSKHSTKRNYEQNLDKFLTKTNMSVDELIAISPTDLKHKILTYRVKQLEDDKEQNSVLAYITAVRSFCGYLNKPIKFRRGQLGKVKADVDSHVFGNGDLRELFEVANTQGKAILATATSLGWEISAFLSLEREKVASIINHAKANKEAFIFREDIRSKTGEPRLAIFNPLAITWLSRYLEVRTDKSKYLFPFTQNGLTKYLHRLAIDAKIETTGKVRFHNIRKWLMSSLSRSGFNEFQIKYVLGKSIGVSDRTYLQTLRTEIAEKYPKIYDNYLNISPTPNGNGKVSKLSEDVAQLKEQVEQLRLDNFSLKYDFDTLKSIVMEQGIKNPEKILRQRQAKYAQEHEEGPDQ